mmetsp:Transcript_1896/g.5733  ORF Transcript_1896/g.5733 Transcript_1896/m.5733 type:complete len:295 (+) Transcript_1896:831-1715(+)
MTANTFNDFANSPPSAKAFKAISQVSRLGATPRPVISSNVCATSCGSFARAAPTNKALNATGDGSTFDLLIISSNKTHARTNRALGERPLRSSPGISTSMVNFNKLSKIFGLNVHPCFSMSSFTRIAGRNFFALMAHSRVNIIVRFETLIPDVRQASYTSITRSGVPAFLQAIITATYVDSTGVIPNSRISFTSRKTSSNEVHRLMASLHLVKFDAVMRDDSSSSSERARVSFKNGSNTASLSCCSIRGTSILSPFVVLLTDVFTTPLAPSCNSNRVLKLPPSSSPFSSSISSW